MHLGLDGIWRAQTYWETNEGNAAKNYQKVMGETRVNAKRVSAVQCCIIPLHIPACIWLKATGQEAAKWYQTSKLILLIDSCPRKKSAEFVPLTVPARSSVPDVRPYTPIDH